MFSFTFRLIGLGTLLFAMLTACSQSPTGRRQVNVVSDTEIRQMGDQAWAETKSKTPELNNPTVQSFAQTVANKIVAVTPKAGEHWDFTVFNDKQVNAFALPGGHIGVYSGILPVAVNEAGLAAVLGHEVGHVIAQHHQERASQQLIAQGVLSGADKAFGSSAHHDVLMGALGMGAQVGVLLPYSRKQETEADELGLQYMAKAGYDPHEAVELWKRMQAGEQGQTPTFMSTHPGITERIADLESKMPEAVKVYEASAQKQGLGNRAPASQ